MTLHVETVSIERMFLDVERQFKHIAEGKGLTFHADLADDAPETLRTDPHRVGFFTVGRTSSDTSRCHSGMQ